MPDSEKVSLRDLIEQRFDALEQARQIADAAMNKRLDGMNEFREALRDQANRMRTRAECEASMSRTDEDIRSLRESRAMLEGKASQLSVTITLVVALIGVAVSAIALFVK